MAKSKSPSKTAAPRSPAGQRTRPPQPASVEVPAWAPVAVYAVVTVLLFREFFFGGTSMLGMDSLALSYFARNFYTEFVQTFHRMPYWNPLLFGGLPFVEGMHGDIFYPPSLAMFFLDARTMWGWKMALHIFLAGVFTYLWLRRGLGLDRLPAFFGGLVFMMGTDLLSLTLPGGDGKLFVSALAPLVFWLTERAVARRRIADFALFALGIALILFTSHMQAAYYCVWGVSLYFLFRVWQIWRAEKNGAAAARLVGAYALAGGLAVGAAAVQFLPPLEYLREYSHRVDRAERGESGYAWSASYSLNPEEIVGLVVPEFIGEIPNGYWGRNPFKGNNEYAGLIPLLLIPILLARRRTPQVWFFIGLGTLTLLYALAANTPLFYLFYRIPGVSLFRSWSIIIFLYALCIATLGAIAAQHLQDALTRDRADDERAAARRVLWIVAAVAGVFALLASAGVITGTWEALFRDAIRVEALEANTSYIQLGFWIAFALAIAVAGSWQLASRGQVSARVFLLLLALWGAVDLYRVGRPFIVNTAQMNSQLDATPLLRADDAILHLQQRRDAGEVFRVAAFGQYGPNDLAVHGLEQLAGHHGNEIGRYRNLIGGDRLDNLEPSELRLADVTNTAYFLISQRFEDPRLEAVFLGTTGVVYRKRDALPRAYLVGRTEVVPTNEAAIARLLSAEFDARNTALLSEPLPAGVEVEPGATGTVEWVDRQMDQMTLRVTPDRAALLVVLDNYYPAWRASVDGRDVPIWRANHTFRAIAVPAGEHTVTFRYAPAALAQGAYISLVVLTLLVGAVLAGAIGEWRMRRKGSISTA